MSAIASGNSPRRPRGTGCIYLQGRVWWVKYYRGGDPFYESSGSTSRADAERLLKRRQGEIATGRFAGLGPERICVAELLELVRNDYRENNRASADTMAWRAEKHLEPALGKVRAIEFGSQHIKRYIAQRRQEGGADGTINRELSVLRRGFSLAARQDPPLVTRSPFIPRLAESNVRTGFINAEQYSKLRDALPGHLKALFVIGYHTGARLGELRQIRWDQVDLMAGEIRLAGPQTKNRRPRTLPVYGEMRTWIEWQRAELDQTPYPDCPWVFHYLNRPIGGHLRGWQKACTEAGIPGLRFHDLRRSAVRNMERAGVPRNVAMAISGHRTESVYRRYDIVSRQDLVTAAHKLEVYLSPSSQAEQAEKSPGRNDRPQ